MEELFDGMMKNVPESVVNLQLPAPHLRDYYRDESERNFWIDDEICSCVLELVKMIMRCNKEDKDIPIEDRKPITVYIDSPGGDAVATWTVVNAMLMSKTKIITINYCTAFSAAALILAAGHERYALPGTSTMVHNGSCAYSGQADQVEQTKKYFDKLNKKMDEYLLSRTKINPRVYKKKAVVDWFMDENEALENGIIDKIVTDFDEIV